MVNSNFLPLILFADHESGIFQEFYLELSYYLYENGTLRNMIKSPWDSLNIQPSSEYNVISKSSNVKSKGSGINSIGKDFRGCCPFTRDWLM